MEIKRTFVGPGTTFVDTGRIAIIASDRRLNGGQRRGRGEGKNDQAFRARGDKGRLWDCVFIHSALWGRRAGDKEAHQERRDPNRLPRPLKWVPYESLTDAGAPRRRKGDERRTSGHQYTYIRSSDPRIRALERRAYSDMTGALTVSIQFGGGRQAGKTGDRRSGKDRRVCVGLNNLLGPHARKNPPSHGARLNDRRQS